MDWSKAKNILIIAFIITNLILTYVLVENRTTEEIYSEEFVNEVIQKLEEKNISIATDIPLETPSISRLTIEYEVYDPEKQVNNFFDDFTKSTFDDRYINSSNSESLAFKDNYKKLIYTSYSYNRKYDSLNEKMLEPIIEDFLTERGFKTNDYRLSNYEYESNRGVHNLEFVKTYKDIYVEKTYMKFQIDETGIKRFERFWVNTKDVTEKDIPINSALSALLTLISDEDVKGKTITEMELCYYFDPKQHDDIVNPKETMGGQATLLWRIKFADGTKKFPQY